jgi:hypothetical protein
VSSFESQVGGRPVCWIAGLQRRFRERPGPWSEAEIAVVRAGPCSGVLIRAHLIPKQRIRREWPRGAFSPAGRAPWVPLGQDQALEEAALVGRARSLAEITWDSRCWVPMCGGPMGNAGHHGMLDAGGVGRIKILRAWLPPELEEFAEEYGLGWSLEADYGPKET